MSPRSTSREVSGAGAPCGVAAVGGAVAASPLAAFRPPLREGPLELPLLWFGSAELKSVAPFSGCAGSVPGLLGSPGFVELAPAVGPLAGAVEPGEVGAPLPAAPVAPGSLALGEEEEDLSSPWQAMQTKMASSHGDRARRCMRKAPVQNAHVDSSHVCTPHARSGYAESAVITEASGARRSSILCRRVPSRDSLREVARLGVTVGRPSGGSGGCAR